jgi:hypothetical protein
VQAKGTGIDAEVRRAVCGSVASGLGLSAGMVMMEGVKSGQDGITIRLSLPAHALLASEKASIIMVPAPRRLGKHPADTTLVGSMTAKIFQINSIHI